MDDGAWLAMTLECIISLGCHMGVASVHNVLVSDPHTYLDTEIILGQAEVYEMHYSTYMMLAFDC